jgi:penicillin-insensitive murein endopeptidase
MIKFLLFSLCWFINVSLAGSNAQDWAKLTTPTLESVPQSIGTYTSGCVSGAVALPASGKGYQVMRLSRNRFYGHPNLVLFIQQLGQMSDQDKLGTLLIGDLGQPRGGPTPSGHRSHQTGLDVDIWFLLPKQLDNRLLTDNERETWSATSVVDMQSDRVDFRQWSSANEKILEMSARHPNVDRIFVNPSIKQELCNHKKPGSALWLQKIRPWWKHDDHFHVRLKCPTANINCNPQAALPEGDGCDAGLDWWFTKEAKSPTKPIKPVPPPPIPSMCEQILRK